MREGSLRLLALSLRSLSLELLLERALCEEVLLCLGVGFVLGVRLANELIDTPRVVFAWMDLWSLTF